MRLRSKQIVRVALACAALCGSVLEVRAQDEETVIRSDTRLVVLQATVQDKGGKLLTNLPKEAFRVLENGVEQPIKLFRREDVPISLGLIIDNSGSMRDKRQRVESAALQFVKSSNRLDEVFIVNFNDEAFLDVPFTGDIKKMEEGLTRIDSRSGTAMRDALDMSIDYMKDKAKRDKKVLLVITDGNDNTSNTTLERLVRKAQQSEVLIYIVGLLSEEDKREAKKAKRAIDMLAEASGGQSYYPKDAAEVERATPLIAQEIRNQYTIAYTPTNEALDGTYRQVKVQLVNNRSATVRTRTGYYATPDQQAPKGAPASGPNANPTRSSLRPEGQPQ